MGLFDFLSKKRTVSVSMSSLENEESLDKTVKETPNTAFLEEQVEKNKAVFSLDSKQPGIDQLQRKQGRLQDKDLKDISNYDAIIGLIVNTRANQLMSFGRKSSGKYERGYILQEKVPVQEQEFFSDEDRKEEIRHRMKLSNKISDFLSNCGTTNSLVKQQVFQGSDSYFKDCSLPDFLAAQTLNLLIFGRCATQIIRNKDGVPIMFRPLPVETILPVIDQQDVLVNEGQDVASESVKDSAEYRKIKKGRRPLAFVQRVDGKNVAFFTESELKMTYLRKQAFEDLDGYPLAPIEQAYYTVSMHFYAQQYQQNVFTKGLASKGIINLSTKEGGVVSPEQVEMFRKLFTNYVARNDNSATIPVISGPIEAKFIPLNATAKELEFLQLYNKVISILCACFQIAPQEIGFNDLDAGNSSLGDGNKQEQIVQGEERGLRQIVEVLFGLLDTVTYETFPEAKKIFKIYAVGLGQNSKEADLAVYKEELQTSGTFGKIWADSERIESFPFGGNVPTSPIFHASVAAYMKMSEFRFYFLGEKDALEKDEYDFFIDPVKNDMYNQARFKLPELTAKQAELQFQQQQLQLTLQEQQIQGSAQQEQPAPEESPQDEEDGQEAEQAERQKNEEKHAIDLEEAKQKMRHSEEKHELEIEKMSQDLKEKNIDPKKAISILQDVLTNRPKSLEDHFNKGKK